MNLIIRTDFSTEIGTGHAMRCLALAQGWRRPGRTACFIMAEASAAFQDRLSNEGMKIRMIASLPGSAGDLAETLSALSCENATAVVLDGYRFDAVYQRALKRASPKLLCLDDYGHAGSYCADLVLNQNLSADASLYSDRDPQTRLLLGTRYALLRREFHARREHRRTANEIVQRILVTMGGSDNDNTMLKAIQALAQIDGRGIEAVVVVGFGNPHLSVIEVSVREKEKNDHGMAIRLEKDVKDMAALMATVDLAVSAAGSTCWELAFTGVPALLITLSDNQRPIAARMHEEGAALNLGWHEGVSPDMIAREITHLMAAPEERSRMAACGRMLVDGFGVQRVVEILEEQGS